MGVKKLISNHFPRQWSQHVDLELHSVPALPLLDKEAQRENYLSHLQKSIVDNVTNIYGILCISTISLIAGAWALYHAWRLNNNSEKLVENLDPDILPTGVFLMLAALASGALLPYFSQALRCNNILSKKNNICPFLFLNFFIAPARAGPLHWTS